MKPLYAVKLADGQYDVDPKKGLIVYGDINVALAYAGTIPGAEVWPATYKAGKSHRRQKPKAEIPMKNE